MLDRLFVYGTLRKEIPNSRFHVLEQAAQKVTFAGNARIQGRLFDLGEYPGLALSGDPDSWVRGEVYILEDPRDALSRLDDYEGKEFERVKKDVVLESGASGKAWVYTYRGSTAKKREIPSGDYLDAAP